LEFTDHSLSVRDWGRLLAAKCPREFKEPPPPPRPCPVSLSLEDRLKLYRRRVRNGCRPIHDDDAPPAELCDGAVRLDLAAFLRGLVGRY
jgi:hypothetical protein